MEDKEILLLYKRISILERFCKNINISFVEINKDFLDIKKKYSESIQLNIKLIKRVDFQYNELLKCLDKYLKK